MKSLILKKPLTALILASGLLSIAFTTYCVALVFRPDYEVTFERLVNAPKAKGPEAEAPRIENALSDIQTWPKWFHLGKSAKFVSPSKILEKGAIVELGLEPKDKPYRHFDLRAEVVSIERESEKHEINKLTLLIISDSSHKLTRLFDEMTWTLEVKHEQGAPHEALRTWVVGQLKAKTHHYKSRILCAIASRVVLNQVFYPDLIELSQFTQHLRQKKTFVPLLQ